MKPSKWIVSAYLWAILLNYLVCCSFAEDIGKSSTLQKIGETYAYGMTFVLSFSRKYNSLMERGFYEEAYVFSVFHAVSMLFTIMFLLIIVATIGVSALTQSHIRTYGTKAQTIQKHLAFLIIIFLLMFFFGDIDFEQKRTFGRSWYHISPWYMYEELALFVCFFLLNLHFIGLLGVQHSLDKRSRRHR